MLNNEHVYAIKKKKKKLENKHNGIPQWIYDLQKIVMFKLKSQVLNALKGCLVINYPT